MFYKSKIYFTKTKITTLLSFLIIVSLFSGWTSLAKETIDSNSEILFQIGRRLFYDSSLSKDKKISCSSCHQQRFAFGYSYDIRHSSTIDYNVTSRLNGRDVLPLFNLYSFNVYMWDGRAKSLEQQISLPIRNEREFNNSWENIENYVNGVSYYRKQYSNLGYEKIDSNAIIKALVAFEQQLVSGGSKYDRYTKGAENLTTDEEEGLIFFRDEKKGNCISCHNIELSKRRDYQDLATNGLFFEMQKSSTKNEITKFKIPSLRNWAYTAPFAHDGRIPWIEFVINMYSTQIVDTLNLDKRMIHYKPSGLHLSSKEKLQLMAFLATLNDSTFVADKRFSNPFRE